MKVIKRFLGLLDMFNIILVEQDEFGKSFSFNILLSISQVKELANLIKKRKEIKEGKNCILHMLANSVIKGKEKGLKLNIIKTKEVEESLELIDRNIPKTFTYELKNEEVKKIMNKIINLKTQEDVRKEKEEAEKKRLMEEAEEKRLMEEAEEKKQQQNNNIQEQGDNQKHTQ